MKHTYNVTGMTCGGCEAKVKSSFLKLPDVWSAEVSKDTGLATIEMGQHISVADLQNALGGSASKYQVTAESNDETAQEARSFFQTYKPVVVLFAYIAAVAAIVAWQENAINWMVFMQIFMGGFFLSFSFFKLINLKGFAESYAMYDIVAKRWPAWGFIYAFIEFGLGIAFITNFNPIATNWITLIVMGISIIGVLQSVLNQRKIQCACLGAVFDLPMSTLTIIEDALMIAMSGMMLLNLY